MTNLDHIAELRAELTGSILTRCERAQMESELKAALALEAETELANYDMLDEGSAA